MTIFSFYSIIPVMPLFLSEGLGMDSRTAGFAIGAFTVAAVFSRMISGYLLDCYGRRIIYFLALIFFSGMFFLYIPTTSFVGIIVLRIAHGITWGTTSAASQTAVVDSVPASRRGEGIGIYGLSVALGMAISPAIGLWIINEIGYTTLFILEGIVSLSALALAFPVTYRPAPVVKPAFTLGNLFERTSIPMSVMAFILYMGFGSAINWVAFYAKEASGGSPGLFFACMAIGTGVTRFTTGKIFDNRGPVEVSAIGFLAFSLSLLLMCLWPSAAILYIGGLLIGVGSGVFMPVCTALINALVPPDRRGAANSTYYTLFECGIGAGIIVTGALIPVLGVRGSFGIFVGTTLIAALIFYLYALPYCRRQQAQLRQTY